MVNFRLIRLINNPQRYIEFYPQQSEPRIRKADRSVSFLDTVRVCGGEVLIEIMVQDAADSVKKGGIDAFLPEDFVYMGSGYANLG